MANVSGNDHHQKGEDPSPSEQSLSKNENLDQWETLTSKTELDEGLERDLIDLSPRAFEEKYDMKVPSGVYVASHDVFDLPRVSPETVRLVARSLEDFTIEEFERDELSLSDPSAEESDEFTEGPEARLLDALAELGARDAHPSQLKQARGEVLELISELEDLSRESRTRR